MKSDLFTTTESDGALSIRISGDWTCDDGTTSDAVVCLLETITPYLSRQDFRIDFDSASLTRWDTQLLIAVAKIIDMVAASDVILVLDGLPDGVTALIDLSRAVPSRTDARSSNDGEGFLTTIGESAIATVRSFGEGNLFLGEALQAFGRFFRGTARFMRTDVTEFIQATGPQALPIVGIINVLLGMILALMGAVQLQQFGAEIYVANLVALGQTREIAPMMTAIVMAGRTGAAYAAQLGTMQVNEEIDALKTFGFSPMDFLVLPRMLALAAMFPLLVLYADALGIFGGYLVGAGMLDLGTTEYIEQTRNAIDMGDIMLGVVKGSVFGVLVAVTGCMQGMHSGRSASAVGEATTQAVVKGIIAIIAMTAVFSVLTNVLGI
jgi:phospholipid/cholesterol/gamma-HCH transport system permease protein